MRAGWNLWQFYISSRGRFKLTPKHLEATLWYKAIEGPLDNFKTDATQLDVDMVALYCAVTRIYPSRIMGPGLFFGSEKFSTIVSTRSEIRLLATRPWKVWFNNYNRLNYLDNDFLTPISTMERLRSIAVPESRSSGSVLPFFNGHVYGLLAFDDIPAEYKKGVVALMASSDEFNEALTKIIGVFDSELLAIAKQSARDSYAPLNYVSL